MIHLNYHIGYILINKRLKSNWNFQIRKLEKWDLTWNERYKIIIKLVRNIT